MHYERKFVGWMLAIIFSLNIAVVPSSVQAYSGNELLSHCQEAAGFDTGYCLGFIIGAIFGYDDGRKGGALAATFDYKLDLAALADSSKVSEIQSRAASYCIPQTATNGQLLAVVVKYITDHPETRHVPAQFLIYVAIQSAFPCAH